MLSLAKRRTKYSHTTQGSQTVISEKLEHNNVNYEMSCPTVKLPCCSLTTDQKLLLSNSNMTNNLMDHLYFLCSFSDAKTGFTMYISLDRVTLMSLNEQRGGP